ncbi:hypothetical protein ACISSW_27710, partial [Escherichia coli]
FPFVPQRWGGGGPLFFGGPQFRVQESSGYYEQKLEIFPNNWTFDNGYMHPGDKPGLGIEFDEKLAAKYPYEPAYLPVARLEDGTLWNW